MENFAEKLKDLSQGQKIAGNIVFFVGVFSFVAFLFINYFFLPISTWRVILPTFVGACAFVLTVVGFLQINTVLMWSGMLFATFSTIVYLHVYGAWRLSHSYPMFFLAFGVASIVTLTFSVAKKMHLFVLVLFCGSTALFFANSLANFNIWLTLLFFVCWVLAVCFGTFWLTKLKAYMLNNKRLSTKE